MPLRLALDSGRAGEGRRLSPRICNSVRRLGVRCRHVSCRYPRYYASSRMITPCQSTTRTSNHKCVVCAVSGVSGLTLLGMIAASRPHRVWCEADSHSRDTPCRGVDHIARLAAIVAVPSFARFTTSGSLWKNVRGNIGALPVVAVLGWGGASPHPPPSQSCVMPSRRALYGYDV